MDFRSSHFDELIGEAEDGGGIVRRIASAVFKSLVEVICMTLTHFSSRLFRPALTRELS